MSKRPWEGGPTFPVLRQVALAWLVAWSVTYARVWGFLNFLHLCDIAVILTCIGLWRGSALLLSSQALSSVILDTVWVVDVVWRFFTGGHIVGGTEYMFEERFPLSVRLLSLFHVALPLVLLYSARRVGYERRALALQTVIAAAALVASRLVRPELNLNFAHRDPFFDRSWGPAPVHAALTLAALVALIYLPTHLALSRLYGKRREASVPAHT